METLLLILVAPLVFLVARGEDPAPGLWNGRQDARNLECRRMSQAQAHELSPTRIPEPAPRGTLGQVDALVCTRRLMREGERPARDEAILSSLRSTTSELAKAVSVMGSRDTTWHVDAFYPEPKVAAKIAVAARTELAEGGHRVSERVPLLAAGDLSVLARMPPEEVYPLACARYFSEGALRGDDAFLGIMLVDARETQLHAGVCLRGAWRWLR